MSYLPAESDTGMFGGNSNWRGPVWMPVNALIIRALLQYYAYYGDDFTVECPTGSGRADDALRSRRRPVAPPERDFPAGRQRPAGRVRRCHQVPGRPALARLILFYEYFHGDNGAGLGASHQTGWTGLVARMMHLFANTSADRVLQLGKAAAARDRRNVYAGVSSRGK